MAQRRWSAGLVRVLVGAAAGSMLGVAAQGQAPAPKIVTVPAPQDVMTALHEMADKAGVIFVGRVSGVQWSASGNVAAGIVEIKFEVEQAVRGCTAGTYVLREWAGLWEGDNQRYRTGQHLLMMLHAPNAAGLSSPVDGMDGAIPIVRGGSAPLGKNSSARQAPPAVDLRWVGTKVLHPVAYASAATRPASPRGEPARGLVQGGTAHTLAAGSVGSAPAGMPPSGFAGPGAASVPAQEASVDTVVGMLTSWQKVEHAVR